MNRPAALTLLFALLCSAGCSTNPVTGREQIFALPTLQAAYANLGFALSSGAQRIASGPACTGACRDDLQRAEFAAQVGRLGAELQIAARTLSPDLFARIGEFQVGVDDELGMETGSSAGGRIALGSGIARLGPHDAVCAFLIAREMAHVIARHGAEDSGARLFSSGLSTLLPGVNLVARFIASTFGSGVLIRSWAAEQRREADEIAVALLELTGRAASDVAFRLADAVRNDLLTKDMLPEGDWAERLTESAARVGLLANLPPRFPASGG